MTTRIESVRIRGFRSLADIHLSEIPGATVLIGPNGSGKSNFMRFFEMLSWMLGPHRLAEFIDRQGGADDQLFGGSQQTPGMEAEIALRTEEGRADYRFVLSHAHPDCLVFSEECFRLDGLGQGSAQHQPPPAWESLGSGHREAEIVNVAHSRESRHHAGRITARAIVSLLRRCTIHQFHDTSDTSRFKTRWDTEDSNHLRHDGGNLAAVLLRLEQEDNRRYELICRHIGRILPTFDRFRIEERHGKALLRWKAKGIDKTIGAHLTSDGSLRFFALVTLLNLPPEMLPDVLLLDEPAAGLHPAAVDLIGGMIRSLATERQIVVATQSPLLVDTFDLDEIVVMDLHEGRTETRKFARKDYQAWLDDGFTSGDLWTKNLLGGNP